MIFSLLTYISLLYLGVLEFIVQISRIVFSFQSYMFISITGELAFNVDSVRELSIHSSSSRSTYAFQFSENYQAPISLWPMAPSWVKVTASHGDELPFLFGGFSNKKYNIRNGNFFKKFCLDLKTLI